MTSISEPKYNEAQSTVEKENTHWDQRKKSTLFTILDYRKLEILESKGRRISGKMYNGSLFLSLVQRQEEAQVGFCFVFNHWNVKKEWEM